MLGEKSCTISDNLTKVSKFIPPLIINKDIGYDIEGGVRILRNFLIVHEFRVVSV